MKEQDQIIIYKAEDGQTLINIRFEKRNNLAFAETNG